MGNLASTDKVVTAEMLQAYHDDHVAPFLGGNVLGAQSRFKQSDILSTSERIVGCDTDGRPLYQKTYEGTITLSSDSFNIVLPSTLKNLLNVEGYLRSAANQWVINFGDAWFGATQLTLSAYYDIANHRIVFKVLDSDYQGGTYHITFQYTKTTDAAGSYYLAGENDYSTDEKIIGTWIDGKPIYRKTVTGTTPSTSGLVTVLPTTTTQILKFSGFLKDSSGWGVFAGSDLNVDAGTQNFSLGYDKDTTYKLWFQLGSACLNRPYTLTLEYTKS